MAPEINVIRKFVSISELPNAIEVVSDLIGIKTFNIPKKELSPYIDSLREDLYCCIEYPYVDKVYRDTYYNFHSTKRASYEKDCIRVSLFTRDISQDVLKPIEFIERLKETREKPFLGYIILRSSTTKKVCRTFISPKAFRENNFHCCYKSDRALVHGIEFDTEGFPHAVQDGEYSRCAEICVWETMEFFSKYPEFSSVLPSKIVSAADDLNFQRSTPSDGLMYNQISYTLKKFGFGVKTYLQDAFPQGKALMRRIFNDYIESGIPVLTVIESETNHAVIGMGHENVNGKKFSLGVQEMRRRDFSPPRIIDSSDLFESKKYLFVDDNLPPYQLASFDNPLESYGRLQQDAKVIALIIPLYNKIYIDSVRARRIFQNVLRTAAFNEILGNTGRPLLIFRLFLTSGRAFKRSLYRDRDLSIESKILIESLMLPRFVWIIQLSNPEEFESQKSCGYVIIDATGNSSMDSVAAIIGPNTMRRRTKSGLFEEFKLNDTIYPMYIENLNLYSYEN